MIFKLTIASTKLSIRSISSLEPINSYTKRGGTGRASFSGQVATVFGGTGFIGRSLIARLCKHGYQVNVPYRGELHHIRDIRVSGELGQVQLCPFHASEPDTIARAMKYSNVVINLIGRNWETRNFSFHDVNVKTAMSIAKEAKKLDISKLIHFSAMNASSNPPHFYTKKGSRFLMTKAEGEVAVLNEFPDAYIVRPADVYGWNDSYLAYYSHMFRRSLTNRTISLYARGLKTFKMPVSVHNVVDGLMELSSPDCEIQKGTILEFYGPYAYSLFDLANYMAQCFRKQTTVVPMLPTTLAKIFIVGNVMPTTRGINLDRLERDFVTDYIHDTYGLHDLIGQDQMQSISYMWPHICRFYCTYLTHGETFENQPNSDCLHPLPISQFQKSKDSGAGQNETINSLLATENEALA